MAKKKTKRSAAGKQDGFVLWFAAKALWVLVVFFGTLTVCAGFFVAFSHGDVPMSYVWVMLGITMVISVIWRIIAFYEKRRIKRALMAKVEKLRAAAEQDSDDFEKTEKKY